MGNSIKLDIQTQLLKIRKTEQYEPISALRESAVVVAGGIDAAHPKGHHERPPLAGARRCTSRFTAFSAYRCTAVNDGS
jgi:hypothetical protein